VPAPEPQKLKWFDFGNDACGIVAVGMGARGVVAIGLNAVGVVAVGINAMGTLCAVGLNALGLVAVSCVNSIAVVALSLVNAIGGFGGGLVNGVLHARLGGALAIVLGIVGRQLKGQWRARRRPPLARLLDLLAAEQGSGWAKAKLLGVAENKLVVGDADGQHTIVAAPAALAAGLEWLAQGRRRVLVRVAVEPSDEAVGETGYRAAAGRGTMLRVLELRRVQRSWRRPESREELDWVLSRSALGGAVAGVAGSLGGWLLTLL
jgi:hypothetical protein